MTKNPDHSIIVGATKLGQMLGRSRDWAQDLLKEWLAEQERGGPQRVFVSGKQHALKTTIAVVQREFGGNIRDPVIMKKLQEHDRDLDRIARRLDTLTSETIALKQQLAKRAS